MESMINHYCLLAPVESQVFELRHCILQRSRLLLQGSGVATQNYLCLCLALYLESDMI